MKKIAEPHPTSAPFPSWQLLLQRFSAGQEAGPRRQWPPLLRLLQRGH